MTEVNNENFQQKLPEITESFRKSKFIAIDLEFSALQPIPNQSPSLFDTTRERYTKLRKNVAQVVPLQVGLTAFHFDSTTNNYFGDVYVFYVIPATFGSLVKSFYFESGTTNFLCLHNFNFNKFAYLGIPYINGVEEAQLKDKINNGLLVGESCTLERELSDAIKEFTPAITKWYQSSKEGEFIEFRDIIRKFKRYTEIVYFLHKHFRNSFNNLWTYESNNCFCLKKVPPEELEVLKRDCKLDKSLLEDLRGFRAIYELLVDLKKPLVGHNVMQDIMIMFNTFEKPLPRSYSDFKKEANGLFPVIFDTKTVFYELKMAIPKSRNPEENSLEGLFTYFKDGSGRHLVPNSSAIECNIKPEDFNKYHDAGWDSFCAGYIFLRLGHFNVALRYPKSKEFVSNEIIGGLWKYKNRVNVIRGSTSHIKLDGDDPASNRPPWLVVESIKNETLDVAQLMALFTTYGYADIRKASSRGTRILVAADNFRTAREISKNLKTNRLFKVRQYSVLRHSPVAQAALLTAMAISGTLLLWISHRMART